MFRGNVSRGGKGKGEDQTRNVFRNVASLHRIRRTRGRARMERDGIGVFFFLKLKKKNSLLVCVFRRKLMGRMRDAFACFLGMCGAWVSGFALGGLGILERFRKNATRGSVSEKSIEP